MSDYELREAREFQAQLREVERAPLADRKAAAETFYDIMSESPELVGERVGWCLDGNYGYGAMKASQRVVSSPRSNQKAQLAQMVAALEWQCPARAAAAAWKKLSPSEKKALDSALAKAIRSYKEEK